MKAKDDCKPDLFEQTIPVWAYSLVQQTKDDNTPAIIYSYPC